MADPDYPEVSMVPSEPIGSKDKKVFYAFQVGGVVVNAICQTFMAFEILPNVVLAIGFFALGTVHIIPMMIVRKDYKYLILGFVCLLVDIILLPLLTIFF